MLMSSPELLGFVAHAVHGEGEIKDGEGRYEGEEFTADAVMVLLDSRETLKLQYNLRNLSFLN